MKNYKTIFYGTTIVNTYAPEVTKTKISGEKKWEDNDNQDGKRPSSVTINLLANGKQVQSTEATQENDWKYEFKDLPKEENGKAIDYTVSEQPVKGYKTKIDGTTIVNTYAPGVTKTKISGEKKWNRMTTKMENCLLLYYYLLANGKQVQSNRSNTRK